jgi:hypothetical protein
MRCGPLFAGATCIGTSALFVKVSEVAAVSTAFWRVLLACRFVGMGMDGQRKRHAHAAQ